jgi:hypothetical protein
MVQVREGNAMDHCGQQWLFFAVVYILRELVEFLFLYSINCSVSKLCTILHNEMYEKQLKIVKLHSKWRNWKFTVVPNLTGI